MKLLSWNLNGIRSAHSKGLAHVLSDLAPDIACFQETKAHKEQLPPEIYQQGQWHFSSATKRGYSGVATATLNSKFAPLSVRHGIDIERFDSEGRFIITEHEGFTLYNIYFPSGTSGDERQGFKYEFLDALLEHFKSLPSKARDKLIITGDFNICHKEIDIHHPEVATQRELTGFLPEERAWMDRFVDLGFVDTFRHKFPSQAHRYSWWSFRANSREKNLGWRIDYIFVSEALAGSIHKASIHENILGSDHCPIMLELK